LRQKEDLRESAYGFLSPLSSLTIKNDMIFLIIIECIEKWNRFNTKIPKTDMTLITTGISSQNISISSNLCKKFQKPAIRRSD